MEALLEALRSGELTRARVDASVRRVLDLKCRYGAFDRREVSPEAAERISGNAAFRARAGAMGVAATTLVRNGEGVLPFDPRDGRRTLVAGTTQVEEIAAAVDAVAGGPVSTWRAATTDPSDAEIAEAVRTARGADRIVVATYSSGTLPAGQARLVRALRATGRPTAVVATGLPYDLASFPEVGTYLAGYAITARPQRVNRTMHRAAAEVLFGRQPGGRLPVTLAGLHPYGHGLRY
ncbi:glycoside hydrolase family 3 C-terminal domain-containing protein [Actinomadura viridis]|uniref:glycoside hydrolase family 3 C-terminal domain-containing protein n=1 Tax=Actinomadura viridis TaxID=58110 RepID=UPI00368B63DA